MGYDEDYARLQAGHAARNNQRSNYAYKYTYTPPKRDYSVFWLFVLVLVGIASSALWITTIVDFILYVADKVEYFNWAFLVWACILSVVELIAFILVAAYVD